MSVPYAEKLVNDLKTGERTGLSTKERRHAVAFLMATQPELTNCDLGDMFKVTERTIRVDKKTIREEKSKLVREDDISLVIADIIMEYERQSRDMEKSKKAARLGSSTYLDHCKGVLDMRLKTVSALQELGYLPKNLGNMTVAKFTYKSTINRDGSIDTRVAETIQEAEIVPTLGLNAGPAEIPKADSGSDNRELSGTPGSPDTSDCSSDPV